MKKNNILFCALFFLGMGLVKAQYTKLLDFDGTNGEQPFGSVILSDNDSVLYGMTNGGGVSNGGVIYSIHVDGTGYQNLYTLTHDTVSGSNPYGSLIRSGNILYGMTSGYGTNSAGTVFSIHTDGSNFAKLFDFSPISVDSMQGYTGGGSPNGTLLLVNSILYGMTGQNDGSVFSINTDGTNYTTIFNFDGLNGQQPGYGALVESNGVLYGTTLYGGTGGLGVLFSIHSDGSGYNKLIDFNTVNGSMPFSSLVLSGSTLYGTTSGGGAYDKGTVFSIHTDGTSYTKLYDFDVTNGQSPNGALTLSGGTLYGATASGGTHGFGTLFSIDTSGNNFQSLFSFNTPNGTQPRATLSMADGVLYGTAVTGGAYTKGTVFNYKIQPPTPSICLVTVDSSHTHNIIVWEKDNLNLSAIDSFVVYREITTNNYQPIGVVSVDSLSIFDDLDANPATTGYRYKLKSKNSQAVESVFSDYHNTIYLTNNGANFSWTPYQVENNTTPVSAYNVYRDDNGTGNFQLIGSTTGNQFGYTDVNFSTYPNASYYVEAIMAGGICNPTRAIFSTSRSNVKYFGPNGIHQNSIEVITMYPNPADNTLRITGINGKVLIRIYDVVGKIVLQQEIESEATVNIENFKDGIYTVSAENTKAKTYNKLVINH